jgi:siroheme synthase (precorrin-2 oxidase/ferrochelatase)
VLVVGGGAVAARRARSLVEAGADVRVVAVEVTAALPDVPVERRAFADDDVDGAWLVLACTGVVDAAVAAPASSGGCGACGPTTPSSRRPGCRPSRGSTTSWCP